jgi:N-methylhydantoinase A
VRPEPTHDVGFPGHAASPLPTPFYRRESLPPGAKLAGPAVITQMDATTVLPPGWRCRVDGYGNLVLERAG